MNNEDLENELDAIEDALKPYNFVTMFSTEQEFDEWLSLGTKSELENLIVVYSRCEWGLNLILENYKKRFL